MHSERKIRLLKLNLKGIVYELSSTGWLHILRTNPASTSLIRVQCTPFANGDPSIPSGPDIYAFLPISNSQRSQDIAPDEQSVYFH